MSAQLYFCSCGTPPKQNKTSLVKHALNHGCSPPPIAKKRNADASPSEVFLNSVPDILKDVEPRWCREDRCFIDRLGYGVAGGHKIACKKHSEGLVALDHFCGFLGCTTKGTRKVGETGYKFCKPHLNELVKRGLPREDIKKPKNKICAHEGCGLCPSFDGNKFCQAHSLTGVSDDKRVCAITGCGKKRPTFGFEGQPKTRCADHKEPGMHSRKLCVTEGCSLSASYGPLGGVQEHCRIHSIEGETLINNKKCIVEGCDKQPAFGDPLTRTRSHCKTHAPDGFIDVMNKRCVAEGCDKLRIDSTEFCVAHGGGKKCTLACCTHGGPRPQYGNPDDGSRICSFGARALMENALFNNDIERARMLMTHFKRKTMMVLNQQSAFRTEIEKKYWKQLDTCAKIFFDESVTDKPKTVCDLRPDVFYLWEIDGTKMAIHIEYDEGPGHEDDDERLKYIAEASGTTGNVYVIRVDGKVTSSKEALCTRTQQGEVVFYKVNDTGREVACRVADAVKERIGWIKQGLSPDSSRPAKVYF